MPLSIFQVDAFASRPFEGNPAAVCLLPEPRDAAWMQAVAQEMNLSETAFLIREGEGWNLRWFTPAVEVDLCGHATLASAHVLWEQGQLSNSQPAVFFTKSGRLTCTRVGGRIEMDFPAQREQAAEAPAGLVDALGAIPEYVGRNQFDYLVELRDEGAVRGLAPDHGMLAKLPVRGVIVTSHAATGEYDFVSRFFAPGSGIAEDPVTGSAHCCLAPYWQPRFGKDTMIGYQASARGGLVHVRVVGERVFLGGTAVTVIKAELVC